MASSVFYRFKSRKDDSRVTFDGTGISVFDLKRDIILANNMAKANDFDLYLYDSTSNQGASLSRLTDFYSLDSEFKDDGEIIPRSSYVIVKRMPAARLGKGKAAFYTAGAGSLIPTSEPINRGGGGGTWHKGAMSKRFDGKDEAQPKPVSDPEVYGARPPNNLVRPRWKQSRPPWTKIPTRQQQWLPCSKLNRLIGKRHKRKCPSSWHPWGFSICIVA